MRSLRAADRAPLEAILRATGVFFEAEIEIALELIDAPDSEGYRFIVAEIDGDAAVKETGTPSSNAEISARERDVGAPSARVAGYSCYGAAPLTDGTFDLYWIAVDPTLHGFGVGQQLMQATEDAIRMEGGRLVLIETASKPSYDKTRAFYLAWGCREIARIPNFYAAGDDKVIYSHELL